MPSTAAPQPLEIYNPVQKDRLTFVQRTDGTCDTIVDVELSPGGGTQLHSHTTYAERFECTAGVLELVVDGETLRLQPGEQGTAPVGSQHLFRNPTDEMTHFRAWIEPGHRGFEQTLIVVYGLANDGELSSKGIPRNPLHLGVLATLSDSRMAGPMAIMNPLLGGLARLARRRGTLDELVARYDPAVRR